MLRTDLPGVFEDVSRGLAVLLFLRAAREVLRVVVGMLLLVWLLVVYNLGLGLDSRQLY